MVQPLKKQVPPGDYKILVIGSGGREFAIVWKLIQDRARNSAIGQIFCAPGNGGTAGLAGVTNVEIGAGNIPALLDFAKANNIYLTIVGPEDPLIDGIVDVFQAEGLRIFGPDKARAKLEGDKAWAKGVMTRAGVPTAAYHISESYDDAVEWLESQPADKRWFVKVSGPALGKGAIGCKNRAEALNAVRRILKEREFEEAGDTVVIEEWLVGYEVSFLCVCSGFDVVALKPAKDYKPVGDGDTGDNTGGMGNACPHPRTTDAQIEEYIETIVKPMLRQVGGLTGIMFVGLMITEDGPKVLEFNMRFGDPETEVILALLYSSLFELLEAAIDKCLGEVEARWLHKKALTVALVSPGYPEKYEKGKKIALPETLPNGVTIIHGGTKLTEDGSLVTNGGRVLYITVLADSFEEAIETAYHVIAEINVEGGFQYRLDIGNDCLSGIAA